MNELNALTLRDDLPKEHDSKERPEETYALRRHLVIVMQRLEEVGRRDYDTVSKAVGIGNRRRTYLCKARNTS